jgi:hypothetical protein
MKALRAPLIASIITDVLVLPQLSVSAQGQQENGVPCFPKWRMHNVSMYTVKDFAQSAS